MTTAVAIVFAFTAFMFVFYDRLVERRQNIVMRRAAQTDAIVTSLFPENVRDRLMEQYDNEKNFVSQNRRLKGYLNGEDGNWNGDVPIADLFPHCSVLFADISGFTAWSSSRDPAQVFILLQSVSIRHTVAYDCYCLVHSLQLSKTHMLSILCFHRSIRRLTKSQRDARYSRLR